MRLRLSSKLAVSSEVGAGLVATPALLEHIAKPLVRFVPLDPPAFPLFWQEKRYRVRVLLGGLVPLGRQWIDISLGDGPQGSFWMRDNGSGDLARKWDHRITIEPEAEGGCTYVDDVDIEAGLLTPVVWSFAYLFYTYRQARWRRLTADSGEAVQKLMAAAKWRIRLDAELLLFATARSRDDEEAQWLALERAHILSQIAIFPHLHVHRLMLGLAIRLGDGREVIGQALRLALAPLGSLTGRTPWGNTGRSKVSAFEPMPVPDDLHDVLPSAVINYKDGGQGTRP